jgi:methylmalonyl-CoA mutase
VIQKVIEKSQLDWQSTLNLRIGNSEKIYIIPPGRVRYLSDITKTNRDYDTWVNEQSEIAQNLYALHKVKSMVNSQQSIDERDYRQWTIGYRQRTKTQTASRMQANIR